MSVNAVLVCLFAGSGARDARVANVLVRPPARGCARTTAKRTAYAAVALFLFISLVGAAGAEAATVTLNWNANSESDLEGYIVSYGTASGQYSVTIDVGNVTSHTVDILSGGTYYFALQAYNETGPSPYSNEVSTVIAGTLSVTNLTANRTSPQPTGTTITFSATATGGTPPYQYKWWIVSGSTQTIGANWSTSNSFAWTPASPDSNYRIRVWARNASSVADAPENTASVLEMSFVITTVGAPNAAPTVSVGADRSVTLPSSVALSGTVSDDGLPTPPGTVTLSWTRVSGPGTVTFTTPNAAATSGSFSAAGAYVLRLTASDGVLTGSDDLTVTVAPSVGTPPPGLVAGYSFNDGTGTTAQDASGNNLVGAVSGATWTAQGKFGAALSFDGVNDWVTVADANALDLTTGMTLEAWVFPTAASGIRDVLIKEGTGVDIYNLYARNGPGLPEANVFLGGSNRWTAGPALALNAWAHMAGTFDGTTLRLHINGVQVASRPLSGSVATSTGALRIGGNSLWGEFFQGLIDEVRIYNRALSTGEIQTDMNTPVGAVPPDSTPAVRSGGQPSGTLVAGTTQATLSLTTDEPATCRYGPTAGTAYAALPSVFATTGATTHSSSVAGLTNGGSYSYYVRCQDGAGNANTTDYAITFSVASPPLGDTVAPVVTMTAPAGGSTVVALVQVTATASDNVGVIGVQFLLNGSSLGAEDTASPYAVAWNSTSVANGGPYLLSARARDAAGNMTTATAVSVTVNNSAPSAGLVAAYSFNAGSGTTAQNTTGTSLTGTLSGATWTTQGRFGNALSFDGVNDWVTVADANALDLTTGMTLEAWVYPTVSGAGAWRNVLIKERAAGEVYNLYANTASNVPSVYVVRAAQTGNPQEAPGTAALPVNAWSHLAATHDGTTLRLYVNGVQVRTRAVAGALLTSTGALRIGGNGVWGEFFQGRIDEVRIYNRALSPAEVQTDMNTAIQP